MGPRLARAAAAACLLLPAPPARAFTFESQLSSGCHELITLDALARAGWPEGQSPPTPEGTDARALDDLLFTLPERSRDGWTMALLIGVRDNDLEGRSPSDLAGLSEIHNDRAGQAEHCLRGPDDDGPAGDASALAACRAFILAETALAIGDGDRVDPQARAAAEVTLAFSGKVVLPVQRFAFHAGRALHALQDSYTHTLRSDDARRVRHVLNFVDPARERDYQAARDGVAHLARLDLCEDTPASQDLRVRRATDASAEYLRAVASPEGGRRGRLARVEAVLDEHLALETGCDADNGWCSAPELLDSCDCSVASRDAHASAWLLVAAALLIRRRRATSARGRGVSALLTTALLATGLVTPIGAHASSTPPAHATHTSSSTAKPASLSTGRFSFNAGLSASLDQAALAGRAGVRWQWSDDFTLGLDVEYNPWISLDAGRFAPGALNVYGTLVYRWWSIGEVDLRLTGHLGMSALLFDLVSADAGSVGPYVGLSLLGVAFRFGDHVVLELDPADVSLPIPSLGGVPFTYRQYRITVGVSWSP